ncbi:hypothetical protein J4Q44_G00390650, partial [Coregonus suidteri]
MSWCLMRNGKAEEIRLLGSSCLNSRQSVWRQQRALLSSVERTWSSTPARRSSVTVASKGIFLWSHYFSFNCDVIKKQLVPSLSLTWSHTLYAVANSSIVFK